jgi:hypothetical protein
MDEIRRVAHPAVPANATVVRSVEGEEISAASIGSILLTMRQTGTR